MAELLETRDLLRIARAWNELRAAGMAEDRISEGHACMVLEEPRE